MQGILYLDKVPKLGVEAPTPTAKMIEKIKQSNILGSRKISLNGSTTPFLRKRFSVRKIKARASTADNTAAADLTSQGRGRKKVAAKLFSTNSTGLEALIV